MDNVIWMNEWDFLLHPTLATFYDRLGPQLWVLHLVISQLNELSHRVVTSIVVNQLQSGNIQISKDKLEDTKQTSFPSH